jgi:ribonuclease HII
MTQNLFDFDRNFNLSAIAGVDEVGRGPLAGPVVAACCILPLDCMIDGINDSKKLSEAKREKLYCEITASAFFKVSVIPQEVIDEINILRATKRAMAECIENMPEKPELVLIDAVDVKVSVPIKSIIKGDAQSYNIAAASIIAKVTRDRLMRDYDNLYPQYGFAKNKGYGTKEHIEALKKCGPCPLHRKSFIKNFIGADL